MPHLELLKNRYESFIDSTRRGQFDFALTPTAECSPYARCFAIFGYGLIQKSSDLEADGLAKIMVRDLDLLKASRAALGVNLIRDKPYMQLLTFTLSALCLLNMLEKFPLRAHIETFLAINIGCELKSVGVFDGRPRSGNQAMFLAIVLLYATRIGYKVQNQIYLWELLNRNSLNLHGFYGNFKKISYLQFQNGYHQYEIFKYLNTPGIPWQLAADNVSKLADSKGHFAPYPGGGGCYDYDAVFIITADPESVRKHLDLLELTRTTLISEQACDGGFCESRSIRPRSIKNLVTSVKHVSQSFGGGYERLRYFATLLRPKHNRIHTHWSVYSREWGESNLWDSWFRMLTLARIDCAVNPSHFNTWGFINFPGIGFHHGFRESV